MATKGSNRRQQWESRIMYRKDGVKNQVVEMEK